MEAPTIANDFVTPGNQPQKVNSTDYRSLKLQNAALNHEEVLAGAHVLQSKPPFFWFDLCGPCNLKCTHCGFWRYGRTSDKEASEKVYTAVVSELLPTASICHLGGTNYGEMTISKNFHRFILDCKKYDVQINLTTNGTRLDKRWFDDLLDTLTVIGFSMEGTGDMFEKIRGFKWKFFLKHVERVCQGRADRGKTFRVEWRFCAHADNIHQLPDMIRLAKSIGVDRIQVMNLIPYFESQKYKMLFYHRSLANRYFSEARILAAELQVDVNIPPDMNTGTFDPPLVQLNGTTPAGGAPDTCVSLPKCYKPWQTCSINELGIVKPDGVYWRPVGDLSKQSFESIWNGRLYRKLRASVNKKPDSICYSCRMPQFDSNQNQATMQLKPGMKELLRSVTTIRKQRVNFTETPL